MNKESPVPRLDLAPKLRRPLSLLNPLDYLRLLYWVFYFPQALRWYTETFGKQSLSEKAITWRNFWKWLESNPIERSLTIQAVILTILTLISCSGLLQTIGFPFNWRIITLGIAMSLIFGLIGGGMCADEFGFKAGISCGVVWGVGFGNTFGILDSTLGYLAIIFANFIEITTKSPIISTSAYLLFRGILISVAWGIAWSAKSSFVSGVVLGTTKLARTIGLLLSISFVIGNYVIANSIFNLVSSLLFGVLFTIIFTTIFTLASFRLDDWLLSLPRILNNINKPTTYFPRTTKLSCPFVYKKIKKWLKQDWDAGLYNANQILAFTLQFVPVIRAVNHVIEEIPQEEIVACIFKLSAYSYDCKPLRFVSENLALTVDFNIFKARLDTPIRACAAGFWYFSQANCFDEPYKNNLKKATEAFAIVRSLPNGEEMHTLTYTLANCLEAFDLSSIAFLRLPSPPEGNLLRPKTWNIIANLSHVIKDAQLIHRSTSRPSRIFALKRALEELNNLREKINSLPRPEKRLIGDIIQIWEHAFTRVATKLEETYITEPVINPYVIGDPVEGKLFVGREDVLRHLEELWVLGHQIQSVVIYSHRRMGKTSVLLNIASSLGSSVQVAYVNLLRLGEVSEGVGEVLMAITDAISEAINFPPPDDEQLIKLPYRTFERYLLQINSQLENQGLIIAIDEFEQLEKLITIGKIPLDFIAFLRGLVQMSPKIAFAFAGLHTLEEMTQDYFQPFFASVIPIRVGFLTTEATSQLLTNPSEDFPLTYTSEALRMISTLTAGQPYLVQFLGFQLVRYYNDQVFEQKLYREPVLTFEDVEAIINNSDFFKQASYYFTGVWGQAAQGAIGQQTVLRILASNPEGLSMEKIRHQVTDLDDVAVTDALNTLQRHDVVEQNQGRWRIIVELFRRWILQFSNK